MSIEVTRTNALGYGFTATYTPGVGAIEINQAATVYIQTPETTDFGAVLKKGGINFSAPTGDDNVQTVDVTLSQDDVNKVGARNENQTNYKFVFVTTYQHTSDGGVVTTKKMPNMGQDDVDARKNIELRLSIVANSGVSLDNAMRFKIQNEDSAQTYSQLSTAKTDFEIVLSHGNEERNKGMNILPGSDTTIESVIPVEGSTNQYLVELVKQAPPSDGASTDTDIANNTEYEVSITGKTNSGHDTIPHGDTIKVTPSNIPVPPTSLAINTKLSGGENSASAPDETNPTQLTITWDDVPDESLGTITVDYGRWNSAATDDGSQYSYTNDVNGYFYEGAKISLNDGQVTSLKNDGAITVDLPLDQTFNLAEISGNDIQVACIVNQTVSGTTLSSAPVLVHAYNPTMPDIEFGWDGINAIGASNQINVDTSSGNQTIKFKTIALWQNATVHPNKQLALTMKLHRLGLSEIDVTTATSENTEAETANSPETVKYNYVIPWAKINDMTGAVGEAGRQLTMSITQNDPNDGTNTKTFTRTTDRTISVLKALNPSPGTVGMTAVNTAEAPPVVVRTGTDTVYDYTLKSLKLEGFQDAVLKSEFTEDQSSAQTLSAAVAVGEAGQALTKNVTAASAYTASNAIRSNLTSTYQLAHSNDWYGAITDVDLEVGATDNGGSSAVLLFEHPEITSVSVIGATMTIKFNTNGALFSNANSHMPLTAYAMLDNDEGTFETKTAKIVLPGDAAYDANATPKVLTDTDVHANFGYKIDLAFNGNIAAAMANFRGVVHLDSSNANSDLKVLQS